MAPVTKETISFGFERFGNSCSSYNLGSIELEGLYITCSYIYTHINAPTLTLGRDRFSKTELWNHWS